MRFHIEFASYPSCSVPFRSVPLAPARHILSMDSCEITHILKIEDSDSGLPEGVWPPSGSRLAGYSGEAVQRCWISVVVQPSNGGREIVPMAELSPVIVPVRLPVAC